MIGLSEICDFLIVFRQERVMNRIYITMWSKAKNSSRRYERNAKQAFFNSKQLQTPSPVSMGKYDGVTAIRKQKTTMPKLFSGNRSNYKLETEPNQNDSLEPQSKRDYPKYLNSSRIHRSLRFQTDQQNKEGDLNSSQVVQRYQEWQQGKKPRVNFTGLEQKQLKKLTLYYPGSRRIQALHQFTDDEGFPMLQPKDSICFRYEIISEMGRGSFGIVYKAYDHKRNELVALKIIKKETKYINQSNVQIQLLEKCLGEHSNNIVQMKYSCLFRGHICMSFELLHQDLYEYSKELNFSGFSVEVVKKFTIQILKGLKCLKEKNIIHCDLKPENLMLKQEGKNFIKIIDFGSGCIHGEQFYNIVQTRYYRAPEIFLGISYDYAIDMWSLGCILVELLIGKPLLSGKTEEEQVILICELLGLPRQSFLSRGKRSPKYFEEGKLKKTIAKGKKRTPGTKKISKILQNFNDPDLIDFVEQILTWEPENRLTCSEALEHPFISQSLPAYRIEQYLYLRNKQ